MPTLFDSLSPKTSTKVCRLTQDVVEKALQSLKTHVVKLQTHIQQCAPRRERVHIAEPSAESKLKVDGYKTIQGAAQDLYHAFSRACEQHSKHRARLRIQPLGHSPTQVQFCLLLEKPSAIDSENPIADVSFLRFLIESQVKGVIRPDIDHLGMHMADGQRLFSSKRTRPISDDEDQANEKAALRQKQITSAPSAKSVQGSLPARVQASEVYPNFCASSQFCLHIKKS